MLSASLGQERRRDGSRRRWLQRSLVPQLPGGRVRPDAGGDARLRPGYSPPPSRQHFARWAREVTRRGPMDAAGGKLRPAAAQAFTLLP